MNIVARTLLRSRRVLLPDLLVASSSVGAGGGPSVSHAPLAAGAAGAARAVVLPQGDHVLFQDNFRWNLLKTSCSNISRRDLMPHFVFPSILRCTAKYSTKASNQPPEKDEDGKAVSKVEDPFDDITYNIPEKPVTFVEGASYSIIILVGLGIAILAGYAVFKELIFEPKEYKIFGKALQRVQNDSQVTVRIGSPVTGYGQESRNRAARQRIPNRVWTDEEGVEHVEVNFYIRGPHGAGKVYSEMFKDPADKAWKFMYLVVEIKTPTQAQLMLESYVPA